MQSDVVWLWVGRGAESDETRFSAIPTAPMRVDRPGGAERRAGTARPTGWDGSFLRSVCFEGGFVAQTGHGECN